MRDYRLPMYASLDFHNDRGYRVDCVPEDEAQERRERRKEYGRPVVAESAEHV